MDPLVAVGGLIVTIAISFFFSGFETGVYSLNRVRLTMRLAKGDPAAQRVERLFAHPSTLIAVVLIGNNLVNFAVTWFGRGLVVGAGSSEAFIEVWNTVLLTPLLFVFGEMTPKNCFRQKADRWVYATSPLLVPFVALVEPVARVLGRLRRAVLGRSTSGDIGDASTAWSRSGLRLLVLAGAEEGVLSGDQGRMLRNILGLRRVRVGDVMSLLAPSLTLDDAVGATEIVALARTHDLSRVLLWRGRPDRIIGYVEIHELVGRVGPGAVRPPPRPVLHLDSAISVREALRRLSRSRRPIGVVTEGVEGNVVGVVTSRGLLETIIEGTSETAQDVPVTESGENPVVRRSDAR